MGVIVRGTGCGHKGSQEYGVHEVSGVWGYMGSQECGGTWGLRVWGTRDLRSGGTEVLRIVVTQGLRTFFSVFLLIRTINILLK